MSALVPYVGGLALRAGLRPGLRLAPAVLKGMANAYRYGRAATVIGRAARSYLGKRKFKGVRRSFKSNKKQRLFSPRNVGESNGFTTCKSHSISNTDLTARDTRTLYTSSLCEIPKGTEINERMRKHVNLRGFKVCFELLNLQTDPLYLNIAVIAPKATNNQSSPSTTDFFRDTSANRARDFDIALSGLEFHCLPINTDDYVVLKHKRFRLGPAPATGASTITQNNSNNYKNVDWYVRLNRQVRWNQPEDDKPTDGDVYVVHWADKMFASAASAQVSSAYGVTKRFVTYFREPKN